MVRSTNLVITKSALVIGVIILILLNGILLWNLFSQSDDEIVGSVDTSDRNTNTSRDQDSINIESDYEQNRFNETDDVVPVGLPEPFTVYPGNNAWIEASTLPGAYCDITVTYLSGPSQAQGLYPKTSNQHGTVRWEWFIGTNTTSGDWPVDVHCSKNGATGSDRTYIYVY